jgi:hypothetical protein
MAVKSAGFENPESRFVDVSDEFFNELLDNSIPKTRWIILKDSLIDYQP